MFKSLKELMNDYPKMREPLIDGVLREGEIMNLVSPPKVGMTMLSLQLALAVASGTSWLGFETVKKKVLYVDGELHCEVLIEKLRQLGSAANIPHAVLQGVEFQVLRAYPSEHNFSDLMSELRTKGYGLVVINPFGALVPGYEDFDNERTARLYGEMNAAADQHRTCLALTHRTRKNVVMEASQGSSAAVSRLVDAHVVLKPSVDSNFYAVQASVRSFAPVSDFLVKFEYPTWRRVEQVVRNS